MSILNMQVLREVQVSDKGSAESVGLPGQLPEALAEMKSDEVGTECLHMAQSSPDLCPEKWNMGLGRMNLTAVMCPGTLPGGHEL